jgi:drug/metabolite transporter (DMT)-like permease
VPEGRSRIPPGVRFMALAALAFSGMAACAKWAGQRLDPAELVFARGAVGLVLSVAMVRRAGVPMLGHRRGLLVLRGVWGFAALWCVYAAIVRLPLAEATVLQYLNPIFTAVLAALWLGERADRTLGASIALSTLGVVLVTRPAFLFGGGDPLDPIGVAAGVAGAFFSACAYVGVRRLAASEHPLVIVLYFPLVATPASIPALLPVAAWPRGAEWLALAALGLLAQVGQIFLTRGLKHEPAGRATALSYLQVVFAAAWGALFFDEVPGPAAMAGAALVCAGTLLAARAAGEAVAEGLRAAPSAAPGRLGASGGGGSGRTEPRRPER